MDAGAAHALISDSPAPSSGATSKRWRGRRGDGQPRPRPRRLSAVLREIAGSGDERIGLDALVRAFGNRSFGAMMLLFAMPNVIPLPPGSSAIFGVPLVIIAAQLALGRSALWLPGFLQRRSIRTADLKRIIDRILPGLRRIERLLSPRLALLFGSVGVRVIGVVCLALAIVLFLPIPGANMLPGAAIAVLSLALLQRDGVAWLVGMAAAAVSFGIVVAVSGLLWLSAKAAWGWLAELF